MSTYAQWYARAVSSPGKPPRLTWVCGRELVLAAQVISTTRQQARSVFPELETEVFTAGQVPERDVWAAALAIPYGGARCVIVREASRLHHLVRNIGEWLDARRELAQCWLILDDTPADDFPRVSKDDKEILAPHAALIRDSSLGQLVRCSMPGEDELAAWVTRESSALISDADARFLLGRAGGDLAVVRDVCVKSSVLAGAPSRQALEVLCDERPASEFAEALLRGDRLQAVLAAAAMGREDGGPAIGLLASRLDMLETIRCAQEAGMLPRDIARRTGVAAFLVTAYAGLARQYGDTRLRRLRQLLAVADSAWRGGAREGVPEAVAACWS